MDRPALIRKTAQDLRVSPHLADSEAERKSFTWSEARHALAGLPGGGLNMAFEAVDRHASGALRDKVAMRFVSRNSPALDLSYGELAQRCNRFAHVLQSLGVGKGG